MVWEIDVNLRLISIAIDCYRLSVYRLTTPGLPYMFIFPYLLADNVLTSDQALFSFRQVSLSETLRRDSERLTQESNRAIVTDSA